MSPETAEGSGEPAPIRLTPTSYLVLGMVRLGVGSGYAIKKVADQSTQNFWPTSLALIYPELKRLEQSGLLDRHDNPQGGRARSAYTITGRGEAALTAWMQAEKSMAVQIRDEAMLKLFLADALADPGDQLELIRRLRERNGKKKRHLRRHIVPAAEAFEAQGMRYLGVTARLSADLLAYAEDWLARLEAELEAGDGGAHPRAAGDQGRAAGSGEVLIGQSRDPAP
jgi:DNA-binding PadR family transcriptional regulator